MTGHPAWLGVGSAPKFTLSSEFLALRGNFYNSHTAELPSFLLLECGLLKSE